MTIKNPNERVMVSFQIPSALKEKSDKVAAARGLSFSLFARKSLHLCAHFDPTFWSSIEHLAEIYGTGESKVIESIVESHITEIKNLAGFGNEERSETVTSKKKSQRVAKK